MTSPFAGDASAVRGAITPLITPFTDTGELDLEAIPRLIDWQLAHGTHGISVGGSTGEPTSQTIASGRTVTFSLKVPRFPDCEASVRLNCTDVRPVRTARKRKYWVAVPSLPSPRS